MAPLQENSDGRRRSRSSETRGRSASLGGSRTRKTRGQRVNCVHHGLDYPLVVKGNTIIIN